MKRELLHTPEGVRDIYNSECEKKIFLEDRLFTFLRRFGYHPIQTPSFEYFDIFGKEIGTIPSNELYKFFDREGNTLVLRPDITPSIARAAAKYYMDEDMPIRFCYKGNTFINNTSYQGRLKETTQLGAELLGDNSVDADAEMIAMVVKCMEASGLKEFQIGIGHADFFNGLIEEAGLDDETEEEIRDLISNKNFFGVEEIVSGLKMKKSLKELFLELGKFYQTASELKELKEKTKEYKKVYKAIERLEKLEELLKIYHINKYVSYELGMVSKYQYYTGIIFTGYTFGSGEPIVKGGRYDQLLSHFGKDTAAIGFVFVTDQLMAALSRQNIDVFTKKSCELIVYSKKHMEEALKLADELRNEEINVELIHRDKKRDCGFYESYAKRNNLDKIKFMIED